MRTIVFVAGLPRSGSTLLISILKQNPNLHVKGSSSLAHLLFRLFQTMTEKEMAESLLRTGDSRLLERILKIAADSYYFDAPTNSVVVDKSRGWTFDPLRLKNYITSSPRTFVLLRGIPDIVRSFVRVQKSEQTPYPEIAHLAQDSYLMQAIRWVAESLKENDDDYLFATYDQFIEQPSYVLDRLYDFWRLSRFQHNLNEITDYNLDAEIDKRINSDGLHRIRPNIERVINTTPVAFKYLQRARKLDEALWHDYEIAKKINPNRFI